MNSYVWIRFFTNNKVTRFLCHYKHDVNLGVHNIYISGLDKPWNRLYTEQHSNVLILTVYT